MRLSFSTADLALARQTEGAEAANAFHLGRASKPGAVEVMGMAGGCLVFAGAGSPLTHALGIGMQGPVAEEEFDRMEEFFRARGSASLIDLCPMADMTVVEQVMKRGYRIIEFNNLMLRSLSPIDGEWPETSGVSVEEMREEEKREFCEALVEGFRGEMEMPPDMVEMVMSLPGVGESFFARIDGANCGTACMSMHNGFAVFSGDSTAKQSRRRGVQTALLRHRLMLAARAGCQWAMACVVPGAASHRNYERCGFDLFYMRVNVMRELA